MAKVERFEDLIVWQKARSFTKEVYTVIRSEPFSQRFEIVKSNPERGEFQQCLSNREGFMR